jgi:hypothetical protein
LPCFSHLFLFVLLFFLLPAFYPQYEFAHLPCGTHSFWPAALRSASCGLASVESDVWLPRASSLNSLAAV